MKPEDLPPSDDELQAFIDFSARFIREQVLDGTMDGMFPQLSVMIFSLDTLEQQMALVLLDGEAMSDHNTKRAMMREAGRRLGDDRLIVRAVTLMSEAWMSFVEEGEKDEYINGKKMPRDDPRRQETIILATRTLDGRNKFRAIPVKRDKDNMMLPDGKDQDQQLAEVRSPLLEEFYAGFAEGMRIEFPNVN